MARIQQTFITRVLETLEFFLSPIFKCVIEVFSLEQTIIKIKYSIDIYGFHMTQIWLESMFTYE